MNKKIILLIILVLAGVLIASVVTSELSLKGGTGAETEPVPRDNKKVWLGCDPPYYVKYSTTDNLLFGGVNNDGDTYVTSWFPYQDGDTGEYSETIELESNIKIVSPFVANAAGWFGVDYQRGYWLVEAKIDGGNWVTIIDEDGVKLDNLGRPYAEITTGEIMKPFAPRDITNLNHNHNIVADPDGPWYTGRPPDTGIFSGKYEFFPDSDLSFRLFGPWNGKVRASYMCEGMSWSDECGWWSGGPHSMMDYWMVVEEADLISSWGNLYVVDNPNPPYQNRFEEGQTMEMKITTEYAGNSGWYVRFFEPGSNQATELPGRVYDNAGDIAYSNTYGGYRFDNWITYEHSFYWDIPQDGVYVEGSNKWKVRLYNAHTDVNGDPFFVWFEGANELAPGYTTMHFDKDFSEYSVGEEMTITLVAEANPDGEGVIDRFELIIYTDPTDITGSTIAHLWDLSPENIGGYTYEGEITFTAVQTSYLYFRPRAWDGDPNDGALSGGYNEVAFGVTTEDSEDKYTITVRVLDDLTGEVIAGANVFVAGYPPKKTTGNVDVIYPFLSDGTYGVAVSHPNYIRQKKTVTIDGANPPDVVFRLKGAFQFIPILIAALVVSISAALAYFLPIWDMRIKIIIVVLGVVLAIVLYLFLSGILTFNLG